MFSCGKLHNLFSHGNLTKKMEIHAITHSYCFKEKKNWASIIVTLFYAEAILFVIDQHAGSSWWCRDYSYSYRTKSRGNNLHCFLVCGYIRIVTLQCCYLILPLFFVLTSFPFYHFLDQSSSTRASKVNREQRWCCSCSRCISSTFTT